MDASTDTNTNASTSKSETASPSDADVSPSESVDASSSQDDAARQLVWSNLPKALVPAAEKLADCIREGGDASPLVAEFCAAALRQPEELLDAAGGLLGRWFENELATLAKGVPPDYLVVELAHGSPTLTILMISHWRQSGQAAKLERLADAAGNVAELLQGSETGHALCTLAEAIALSKPVRAKRLLELAEPLLSRIDADPVLERAVNWQQAGDALKRMDSSAREFWRTKLGSSGDSKDNGNHDAPPEMIAALNVVLEELSSAPKLFTPYLKPPPTTTATDAVDNSESADEPHPPSEEVLDPSSATAAPDKASDSESEESTQQNEESIELTTEEVGESSSEDVETEEEPATEEEPLSSEAEEEESPASPEDAPEEPTREEPAEAETTVEDESPTTWAAIRGENVSPVTSTTTADAPEEEPSLGEAVAVEGVEKTSALPGWNAGLSTPESPPAKRSFGVLVGLLACIAVVGGGIAFWKNESPPARPRQSMSSLPTAPALPVPTQQPAPKEVATDAKPPASESAPSTPSLSSASGLAPSTLPSLPASSAPTSSAPANSISAPEMREATEKPAMVATAITSPPSPLPKEAPPAIPTAKTRTASPEEKDRLKMKDEILQRHPAVARWHQRIVSERFEKVKKLLTGEELYLSTDQPEYAALLETLVLDPPEDASTRDVVCKQAIRRLPPQMLVPLFEKGLYPGSPNGKEIQKACSLLLALRKEALGPSLAARVEELTKKVIE